MFDVHLGNNLVPSFADVDCDGELESYAGDWNGRIHFFKNNGTAEQFDFVYMGELEGIDLAGRATPGCKSGHLKCVHGQPS